MSDSAEAEFPERASVPDLATRLAKLIPERGLVPGDRFLTTAEAAVILKVRRDVANRALQVLEHRGQIDRAQRIGSRVAVPKREPRVFDRVNVVVQVSHRREQAWSTPAFQVGLHAALPGCELNIEVVSVGGAEAFFKPLLRRTIREGQTEGLVLVRCDYPTQRLAADCGLPAVLYGSAYAGVELPSLDVDGRQMGQLQAESLVGRGCERLVVVRRDRSLPGDRAFMEGFRHAASGLGFGCGEIDELQLAPFADVVTAELAVLFQKDAKLGIACATRELSDATWAASRAAGRVAGENLWLHCNHAGNVPGSLRFPYLAPVESDGSQGEALGRLLAGRLAHNATDPEHRLVACELVEPEGMA